MLTTVSFSNASAVTMLPVLSNESAISILNKGSAMLSTAAMRINRNITFYNATPNPQLEYERTVYMWLVPIMVFVLTIAFIGNGVIVLSAPWLNRPINPYHRLCVSLAAADMWVANIRDAHIKFAYICTRSSSICWYCLSTALQNDHNNKAAAVFNFSHVDASADIYPYMVCSYTE
uniref:G_PROTEIN_RECEP_F1_2 domain-containing protein n=1 Tax=Panagrellus redivivus TaxID=6233 RepID=A0A7E4W7E6_PANRE